MTHGPRRIPFLLLCALFVSSACASAACGGKILEEGPDGGGDPPDGRGGLDGSSPDASTPDMDAAVDATSVHGVAWAAPMDAIDDGSPYVIAADQRGGVVVATTTTVARWDASGHRAWRVRMVPEGKSGIVGGLAIDRNGDVAVAGPGMALLAGSDGHTVWTARVDGLLDTRGAAVLGDGSIVHVGWNEARAAFGSTVLPTRGGFVTRYDGAGNVLAASHLYDLFPEETGPFGVGVDRDGDARILVQHAAGGLAVETFDAAMHRIRSISLPDGTDNAVGAATNDAAFAVFGDAVTPPSIQKVDVAGKPLWTFQPPKYPTDLSPPIVADETGGAITWAGTLLHLDANGTATDLTPNRTLEAAVNGAVGTSGFSITGAKVAIDRGAVFVAGVVMANPLGGGRFYPFVAKIGR